MAELITCPSCNKQLQVPDSQLGELVQCPECQHKFTATATSMSEAPIPSKSSKTPRREDDEDYSEKPRRRKRFDDDDDREDLDDLNVRYQGDIPNYMTQAILVTLCCCWPLGIVAIVKAARVNSAMARGDYEAAMQASADAKLWCWISFLLGLILQPLIGMAQIMLENQRF